MNENELLILEISSLLGLIILLFFWMKYCINKQMRRAQMEFDAAREKYSALKSEYESVKLQDTLLQKDLDERVALYDITKDICRSLNEESVFDNFNSRIDKYIDLKSCKFSKEELDAAGNKDHTVYPIKVAKKIIGYLIGEGVKKEDEEKFHILAHQFMLGIKRAVLYERVQELAITDSLTRLFTRRYWFVRFNEELERSEKFGYKLSCLMLDVDHFKHYNDHYGHMVGEVILKEVASIIKENIRQIDLVGRYGGEEFCVFLTETDIDDASFVAERIRKTIENEVIRAYDEAIKITISIGISVFPKNGRGSAELISRADEALYQAKNTGRNKVCVWGCS